MASKHLLGIGLGVALLLCQPACEPALYWERAPQRGIETDGKLHIFLLGTGDPEIEMQAVRRPSCLAIIADDQFLLFDAGEGAVQSAAASGLPYHKIENVFISHWHSDHFAGLAQVVNGSWVKGRKTPLTVHGPQGVLAVVPALNKAYELDAGFRVKTMEGFLDPAYAVAQTHELPATKDLNEIYAKGKLKVSSFEVDHAPVVPALGFVIEYDGFKLVYSGDTKVVETLERHSRNADVLVSEALSRPLAEQEIEYYKKQGNAARVRFTRQVRDYHADSLDLAAMCSRAGVRQLVLTHLCPAISNSQKEKAKFSQGMDKLYRGKITVSSDGDEIQVSKSSDGKIRIQCLRSRPAKVQVVPARN